MPIAGRLSDRIGARALVPAGGAVVALTALAYTQAGTGASLVWLGACSAVCGVGLGLIGAPTMASVYRSVPAEAFGTAFWWMVAAASVLVLAGFSLPGRPAAASGISSPVADEPERTRADRR